MEEGSVYGNGNGVAGEKRSRRLLTNLRVLLLLASWMQMRRKAIQRYDRLAVGGWQAGNRRWVCLLQLPVRVLVLRGRRGGWPAALRCVSCEIAKDVVAGACSHRVLASGGIYGIRRRGREV